MVAFCADILQALGKPEYSLSVVFVGVRKMRALNWQFRAKDYPTDVLSFHYDEDLEDGRKFLGEVVVAPEIARDQADRHHTPREREMRRLLIHGILHLLGHDHEADSGEMVLLQRQLLRHSGTCHPPPIVEMGEGT